MQTENSSAVGGDSDEDFDWEEVEVPQHAAFDVDDVQEGPSSSTRPNIEITIQAGPKKSPTSATRKRGVAIHAERVVRVDCHKIHTVCLLANARTRNKWLNDPLLHARLLSLTPLALQNAFATIHKSRVPEAAMRGRLFESAISRLVEWWSNYFEVEPSGHIKNRTFEEVRKMISADSKGKGRAMDIEDDEEAEVIRSEKSLMKHALMRKGSRDTSAQLFTALCRALRIPARLVTSLQSVPWQANVGKPKPAGKTKGKDQDKTVGEDEGELSDDEDMEMEEVSIPGSPAPSSGGGGKGRGIEGGKFAGQGQRLDGRSTPLSDKGKTRAQPVIKLRKSRGQKLGTAISQRPARRERTPDPTISAPVFWTEVFSKPDARWLPVDPIRSIVNKRKVFDPITDPALRPDRSKTFKVENRMVYVVAFEEDGYARDVTPRYAREYGAKVAKIQQGGKGRKEWWDRITGLVRRPYRLHRDDLEDEELQLNQMTEAMPTSMVGFKDHPLYVLERHLKREEVIYPMVELGKFRGEPVYARSSVLSLKAAENWMRQGRKVKEGCQPMKWVKQRAVTVNKKRAIEMAMADRQSRNTDEGDTGGGSGFASENDVMQGLYAESQTELYTPDPVVDGKVPKNDFGNIDLYVPSMLPAGAAHIPYKGTAKIARQLGFDYAEAVTGFEFKKRRAFPVISGVVVAAENEEALLEAYWEAEHEAEEKRQAKRHDQALKRWTRLVQGLRIRQRLQEQYADRASPQASDRNIDNLNMDMQTPGGFLTGADDVVQPYTMPRNLHEIPKSPRESVLPGTSAVESEPKVQLDVDTGIGLFRGDILDVTDATLDQEVQLEHVVQAVEKSDATRPNGLPKTMEELAEAVEIQKAEEEILESANADVTLPPNSSSLNLVESRANGWIKGSPRTGSRSGTGTPAGSSKKGKSSATSRSTSLRSRKRARGASTGPSSASDDEKGENDALPPSTKRARTSANPVPVIKSDRVLRTRKPKDSNALQEERDREEAYRRAIAQ